MRVLGPVFASLALAAALGAARPAAAAEVSLFNGLPHPIEVVRLLEDGREHRPWAGPMEPASRWRLRLPEGTLLEFRREGLALARLRVGESSRQGHVIRLPGIEGPVPPPPPPGCPSEFPGWRRSSAVQPVSGVTSEAQARPPVCEKPEDEAGRYAWRRGPATR